MAAGKPRDGTGSRSGYPERQPADRDEARKPGPRKPPDPDEGGLDREPERDGNPADT